MLTTLATGSKVETANTNLDGTGTMVLVGAAVEGPVYVHEVMWNALGTNALCVGRIFADITHNQADAVDKVLVVESTLAATTASNTAALASVTTSVGAYYPAGTKFWASVSVDLTASEGYVAKLHCGDHFLDF